MMLLLWSCFLIIYLTISYTSCWFHPTFQLLFFDFSLFIYMDLLYLCTDVTFLIHAMTQMQGGKINPISFLFLFSRGKLSVDLSIAYCSQRVITGTAIYIFEVSFKIFYVVRTKSFVLISQVAGAKV